MQCNRPLDADQLVALDPDAPSVLSWHAKPFLIILWYFFLADLRTVSYSFGCALSDLIQRPFSSTSTWSLYGQLQLNSCMTLPLHRVAGTPILLASSSMRIPCLILQPALRTPSQAGLQFCSNPLPRTLIVAVLGLATCHQTSTLSHCMSTPA